MKRQTGAILAIAILLNGCGDSRLERTGSGAAIGGGIGAVSGALCCNNPGDNTTKGLFIGAAVGALIGLLIDHPLFFNYHDQ